MLYSFFTNKNDKIIVIASGRISHCPVEQRYLVSTKISRTFKKKLLFGTNTYKLWILYFKKCSENGNITILYNSLSTFLQVQGHNIYIPV